jgi:hypothetical protein
VVRLVSSARCQRPVLLSIGETSRLAGRVLAWHSQYHRFRSSPHCVQGRSARSNLHLLSGCFVRDVGVGRRSTNIILSVLFETDAGHRESTKPCVFHDYDQLRRSGQPGKRNPVHRDRSGSLQGTLLTTSFTLSTVHLTNVSSFLPRLLRPAKSTTTDNV